MIEINKMIDTLIRVRKLTQTEISEQTGISQSNLSKFLNTDCELRSNNLTNLLLVLGIDLKNEIQKQINITIGVQEKEHHTIGAAVETLLNDIDPITARTIIETLSSRTQSISNKGNTQAMEVVNNFKLSLMNKRGS